MHAATSDRETDIDIRLYDNPTIFERLEEWGKTWHIYFDGTPQVWAFRRLWDTPTRHANWYRFAEFANHVAAGLLPTYSFIEPNHGPPIHVSDANGEPVDPGNNQHPENNLVPNDQYDAAPSTGPGNFSNAEMLIATVYEALRKNRDLFERTLLLVTYDEHGGLFDHVPPPTNVPPPGTAPDVGVRLWHHVLRRKAAAFDFRMLGPRVPAVLISPYVPAGFVDATTRDHASVPATLRQLFGPENAVPLTERDRWARSFHAVATLEAPRRANLPDLSTHLSAVVQPGPQLATIPLGSPTNPPPDLQRATVPQYYEAFVKQAHQVHRRLVQVGEPEAAAALPQRPGVAAQEIAEAFAVAAERHRALR
jgi:phospholipase C